MKKILTTVIIALLCSSMFTILVRAQLLTADVYVDPPTFTAQVGETFDVNVTVSNVQNLWAWQAGVQWDKNILQVVSFTWGDFQEALAYYTVRLDPVIDGTAGKTSTPALETAIGFSTIPVSSNAPVKLLTITFQAIGVGSSTVSLTDVALIGQDPTVTTSYPRWSDVNFDSYVDMKDITITIKSYLNISPYNQDADFNNDGTIDITDIAIVTSDFAKWSWGPDWRVTKTIYEITAILQSCSVITFNVINTPTGTSVAVSLLAGDVTLSFDSVTSSGITEAATTDTGPEAPTGFLLGAPGTEPIYYEITTTATYAGPIQISITYDPSRFTNEADLKLMQYDTLSTTWGDVTTSVDKENNIIYGQVFHLSIFAVMEPIPHANIDVDPDTLNLGSKGKWITSYIELPEGYAVTDIDLSTIMLNGTIQVYASAPTCIGDYDTDGIQDLMVKFDRAAVQQYILDNVPIEAKFVTATLTVTGRLNDGTLFQGSDTIKITMPGNYWKIIRLEKLGKA